MTFWLQPRGMTKRRALPGRGVLLISCWFGLGLLLPGCATDSGDPARAVVSGLEDRTGHGPGFGADSGQSGLPPGISLADPLTDSDAVAVALWNNAGFHAALADLGLSRADLLQARMLPNPTFSVLFPLGPKQLEFAAKFPLESIWLRPKRIAVAEIEAERIANQLVQTGLNLVRDVKVACADLRLAERRSAVALEEAGVFERISALTGDQFEAGEVGELEVTRARINALQGREEAGALAVDVITAREQLRGLLGLSFDVTPLRLAAAGELTGLDGDLASLLERALAARPDLRAAELSLESAGRGAGLARWEWLTLSGALDANGSGKDFEIGPGVELPLPIFNQNQASRTRAQARLEKAAHQYVQVRNQIALEVRQSHARWEQAEKNLASWRQRLLPAIEAAGAQVRSAHELGDLGLLPVLEASRDLVRGRQRLNQIEADYARSLAELERAVGYALRHNNPGAAQAAKLP